VSDKFYILFLFIILSTIECLCATEDASSKIPEEIKAQIPQNIIYSKQFSDKTGQHILLLIKEHKTMPEGKENISLKAFQFVNNDSKWIQEWIIKDFVDCQNLDIEGDFMTDLVSITDLDSNGICETTVAYSLICSGDVSPKVVKVIMRQGNLKYAVRGESLIKIDKNTQYGGEYKTDDKLKAYPVFMDFMVAKWKKAAGYY
jgi:hypothetical protein